MLIVTHGGIADELVRAAISIVGPQEKIVAVGVDWNADAQTTRRQIEEELTRLGVSDGVLILTDMFGGTPSNLALPFLQEARVEIVTGVNLPMLVRAMSGRNQETLVELAGTVSDRGRKAIEVASELLAAGAHAPTSSTS